MLVSREECIHALRCPRTKAKLHRVGDKFAPLDAAARGCAEYPIVGGVPILIDFRSSVLRDARDRTHTESGVINRKGYGGIGARVKKLVSPPKKITRKNVVRLRDLLLREMNPARLLMVGGGSIGQGMRPLYEDPSIQIYAFDIYASPNVQFVADAHQIPLPNEFFDAVVIQAVLEHVLQPADVVAEVWRVLKPNGLIYAETPFMQQVHEGAYDFTRFTESGHRYLFRRFERIHSGASAGPGTQFMWSVEFLVRGVFRSVTLGKLAKVAFFWAQYLDYFVPPRFAVDGASGVFFLGRKSENSLSPAEIVPHYQGAQ